MKTLLTIFALMLALTASAATRISLTITVTNVPVTGNSNTINASLRQWTNSSGSTTILTNLTGVSAAATNLFNNYADFPVGSGITHRMTETNVVVFTAPLGVALSGSAVGGWASSVLSTQSGPSTFTALWPLENMVGETNRTNQGSSLVYGLGIYSTNAFPTNATALSNYITKGAAVGPQYVTSELRLSGNLNNGTGRLSVSNLLNYGLAIRSEGSGGNSLQLGSNAVSSGPLALAVGNGSLAQSNSSVAIGVGAISTNGQAIAIGTSARTSGTLGTAVGDSSVAGESSVAIGSGSIADTAGVALGPDATTTSALGGTALGNNATVSAHSGLAIGYQAIVAHSNSTALGYSATTTETNQVRLGTSAETVSIPGVLAVSGTITNSTWRGTNVINGRLDFTAGARTTLANGYNSGTILGTNVYLRMSGPSAAYTNAGFAAAVDGTWHKLQLDNPGLSYTILDASGLEATAGNRILTGTGALINSTNNPVFVELIYDGASSRWRVIAFR